MVAAVDRYYQIARCFRDEDLRSDRQPEFTQLDLEMAFVDEQQVMGLAETLVRKLFNQLLSVQLGEFATYKYDDLIASTGSDRPDLRNPLRLIDIKDQGSKVNLKYFLMLLSQMLRVWSRFEFQVELQN